MLELTDPRGPDWVVASNPTWTPIFMVDNRRTIIVCPTIVYEVTLSYLTAYYTVSRTDPRQSYFYRERYRPTKWERLSGV